MLVLDELTRAVELQEKSYRLLRWVHSALATRKVSFSRVHEAMSASDAALEWIERHRKNFPENARPAEVDVRSFSRLFASYLTTSFELEASRRVWRGCGCSCGWCSYLSAGPKLKLRKISRKARKNAAELKSIYLQQLAQSCSCELEVARLTNLCERSPFAHRVSLATYATELVRRTRFASQGLGVLVLWREIAWENHSPIKGFRVAPADVIAAEQSLLALLTGGDDRG